VAWVRRELRALGIPPLKKFGQHFLIDKTIREELVETAALTAKDTVLEIGPGLGFLTTLLADRAGRVIAVEKDRTLAAYLMDRLSGKKNVRIIQADILATNIPEYTKIVSSPPYNISSKLILLILKSNFKLAALLLQREFARRLTAVHASSEYGRLSVMLQSKAKAELIAPVPRSAFFPPPRADSSIVTIEPTKVDLPIANYGLFEELVRGLFTQRRRRLTGVLSRYLKRHYPAMHHHLLERVTVLDKRVYEMSPEEFVSLSNQISDILAKNNMDGDSTGN